MKKIILVGAVALLGLASCKKDRTCECTIDGTTEKVSVTYPKSTKSDAKEACDAGEIAAGVSCELK
jgi:hypothetical protein